MVPDTNKRNVFIEGPLPKKNLARQMIAQMISDFIGGHEPVLPEVTAQSLAFQYQQ
jgi:hypothetical protein